MNLVLANRDYGPAGNGWGAHMSDEGLQLQLGLQDAGWTLAGAGYGDGCRDVPALLAAHRPDVVFVQDVRDWDPNSPGAFRKDIGFTRIRELGRRRDIFKLAVVKDAGSVIGYQRDFCGEIAPDAILVYYHPLSVEAVAPWLRRYPLIRTYHSVDAERIAAMDLTGPRQRAIVSGALNANVYPLRERIARHRLALECDVLRHPGYSNSGTSTPGYLATVRGYKVSLATASRYGFALRKIIEAVAVGATPVTDLPAYDRLPEIDGALVRIPTAATVDDIRNVIDRAERDWILEERLEYAERAWAFYDYRAAGQRISFDVGTFSSSSECHR